MVADTRTATGPDRLRPIGTQHRPPAASQAAGQTLRPLNTPRAVAVREDNGRPVALSMSRMALAVEEIRERWRIDDDWWRRPISRTYYELLLESGDVVTVFKDLVSGEWFQQQY